MQPETPTYIPQNPTVAEQMPIQPTSDMMLKKNKVWTKVVPITNYVTIGICLGFLLIIDLRMLLDMPDLAGFFFLMLMAFAVLCVFTVAEYFVGRAFRYISPSRLDSVISLIVTLRSVIVVLNVIPFIQLLGLLADILIVPILVIVEIIIVLVMYKRLSRSQHETNISGAVN